MIEDILEFCGYKSVSDLLNDHMTVEDMSVLVVDMLNSPEDAYDFIKEAVEQIATDLFEWVDRDAMMAKAEDMAYAKYRDGE